jgi:lauroyl/myristoyl acyltransferase
MLVPRARLAAAERVLRHLDLGVPASACATVARQMAWESEVHALRQAALLVPARRRAHARAAVLDEGAREMVATARRSGAVLLSAHLGEFDLAAASLVRLRLRVVVPVRTVSPRIRHWYFNALRRACGHQVVAAHTNLDALVDQVVPGAVVVLMADRRPHRNHTTIDWLGAPATLSTAPMRLAVRAAVPIFAAASVRVDGRRVLCAGQPRVTQVEALDDLAAYVRQAPTQWHVPVDLSELPWSFPRE